MRRYVAILSILIVLILSACASRVEYLVDENCKQLVSEQNRAIEHLMIELKYKQAELDDCKGMLKDKQIQWRIYENH